MNAVPNESRCKTREKALVFSPAKGLKQE